MLSQYNRKEEFTMFKVNDTVQVLAGAIYLNNEKEVPESLLNTKLYVREVKSDSAEGNIANIETFYVQVPTANLPVYYSPNKTSGVVKRLNRFALLTIVDEKNGFGKIKVGSGWVELSKVTRL